MFASHADGSGDGLRRRAVAKSMLVALYRRESWREKIEIWGLLGGLLLINHWWGPPGLLIAFGVAAGLALLHFAKIADASERRRRSRLRRALQGFLHAEHEHFCGPLSGKWRALGYDDFIKQTYGVQNDWELLDTFDNEGATAEDLNARRDEERQKAERQAERAAKTADLASQTAPEP